jgi:predicted dienelactone hydrolase
MRPLELIGFLCAILPVFALLGMVPISIGIRAAGLSCIILVVAAVWLGAYWQLIPLYLGAVFGLMALLSLARHSRWTRATAAAAVTCLLITTAAFTYILPMFRLPRPTGNYAVGTRIVHLVDPARMETHVSGPERPREIRPREIPREIMVQIWYPASPDGQHLASYRTRRETTWLSSYMGVLWTHSYRNAPVGSGGGPFPVLLFNPAWKGQRTQNTYQVEDLASHGFIVVGIDHTYNSGPTAFPDGRVIQTANVHDITDFSDTTLEQQIAIGDKEVRIEAGDDILALNYLAAADQDQHSPWFHRVDANNAGAFGHSFGGTVSAQVCYQDPRVKAAMDEDGWLFGDVAEHGLDKPFMVMSEDGPDIKPAQLQSTNVQTRRESELNVRDIENFKRTLHQFGGYMITIRHAKHENFRDRPLYSPLRRLTEAGAMSPQRAHQIIEDYTLQFFSHYLLNKPEPLLAAVHNPYKEVQFENWYAQNALIH